MKTLKIIVQPTRKCLGLLKYINKNIDVINKLGARIQIEKIDKDNVDESTIEIFRKKGITRLPVLLSPEGKIYVGLQQIVNNFERTLNSAHTMQLASPCGEYYDTEMGSNPDMNDFWLRELYAGYDKNGKMVPRKDKDEAEGENADIEKRLSDYQRNVPRHRRAEARERDYSPPARTRRDEDNIADEDPMPPRQVHTPRTAHTAIHTTKTPRLSATGDPRGDDMDQRILAALMDNS